MPTVPPTAGRLLCCNRSVRTLELAASEYASAVKRLGAVSLSQAVDFYLKRHPTNLVPKMVEELSADEMINLKRADQLEQARYVKQLGYAMNRFAVGFIFFACATFTERMWMPGYAIWGVGPPHAEQSAKCVQALFNFRIARRSLSKRPRRNGRSAGGERQWWGRLRFTPRKKWQSCWRRHLAGTHCLPLH